MNKHPRWRVSVPAVVLAVVACCALPGWAQGPKSADPDAAELLFWETIRNSENRADFEEYLKQYPNGKFAGLARIRTQAKSSAQPAPASPPAAGTAKVALAPTREAGGLPQAGARWKYRHTDRKYPIRGKHVFEVRIDSVNGRTLNETLSSGGATGAPISLALASDSLRFTSRALPESRTLLEFAPYLNLPDSRLAVPLRVKANSGYPKSGNLHEDWQVTIAALPDAPVSVPAGRFQASRVELKGERRLPSLLYPARFQITLWYAPEVKRYVRTEHKAWTGAALALDEVVELLEFSGVAAQ